MTMTSSRRLLAAAALLVAAAGCTDLAVQPKSTVTGSTIFGDPASYKAFLAKLYTGLVVTGQRGPDGSGDIQSISDEGFSSYDRLFWKMQELPTDEAVIAWGDAGIQELNTQEWANNNQYLQGMFARIYFQVSLANEFLRETADGKLSERGVTGQLRTDIATYRAEARFLRALSLYHGMDLFGNIPIVDENFVIGSVPPAQNTRAEVFHFIENELNAIKSQLPAPHAGQYGRADQGAVDMLLAKLYLNAKVYTGTERYADVITALTPVLGAYTLDPSWRHNFQADNNTSPEIIFAVPQDGQHTRSWGGTTFLVHAGVGGNMNPSNFGIDGGWFGLRTRPEFLALFPNGTTSPTTSPDKRLAQVVFTNGQSLHVNNLTDFNQGYGLPKYQNVTSGGASGSDATFPDTDFPMFRLADAYLMYAEAVTRGAGGSRTTALGYVNALRDRAYGNVNGRITDAELTTNFLLDERGRELYWEAHRRQDLIRYGLFTGGGRIWEWKGNVQAGKATCAAKDLYPIPATAIIGNPNLAQNPTCTD